MGKSTHPLIPSTEVLQFLNLFGFQGDPIPSHPTFWNPPPFAWMKAYKKWDVDHRSLVISQPSHPNSGRNQPFFHGSSHPIPLIPPFEIIDGQHWVNIPFFIDAFNHPAGVLDFATIPQSHLLEEHIGIPRPQLLLRRIAQVHRGVHLAAQSTSLGSCGTGPVTFMETCMGYEWIT